MGMMGRSEGGFFVVVFVSGCSGYKNVLNVVIHSGACI